MEVPLEAIAFFGIFLGVLLRTIVPWIRKVSQGKIVPTFELRYIISAISSLFWNFVLALQLFKSFSPPETSGLAVLIAAILFGWFGVDVSNEIMKIFENIKKIEEAIKKAEKLIEEENITVAQEDLSEDEEQEASQDLEED